MPKPVIVRTPLSRRRLLTWATGIAGLVGASKAASWLTERSAGPGGVGPQATEQPADHSLRPHPILVAAPTDGVYPVEANDVRDHLRDALPVVNAASGGRY